MTKSAAIYQFFAAFGLDTYEENSVYTLENAPSFPYLTYEQKTGAFDGYDTSLSFSLWYRSTSWTTANAKVEEISAAIGRGGKVVKVDGGYLLFNRGTPFAQSMADPSDSMIKRKLMSVNVHFYTSN